MEPTTHHACATTQQMPTKWIMDFGATHHLTNDLDNMHLANSYHGQDQLIVGDDTTLPITYTGNTVISTTSNPLQLQIVLHVPKFHKDCYLFHLYVKLKMSRLKFSLTISRLKD